MYIRRTINFLLLIAASFFAIYPQEPTTFSIDVSPLPAPTGAVNDYVGIFDVAAKAAYEQKLKDFKNKNIPPPEFAVAVVKTTGDRPMFEYSLAVARGWKIGSSEDDNPSVLLVIAIDDRKYFTQTSRDAEDELPDGLVGEIQRTYLVPQFRKASVVSDPIQKKALYTKGITDTLDALMAKYEERTSGSFSDGTVKKAPEENNAAFTGFECFVCAVILLVFIVIVVSSRKKRGGNDRDKWNGGGFGGGGSGWVFFPTGGSSSSHSDWGSSWGSGSSSSGSDWGGFGGGGDFGGGGAGGDW